MITSTMIYWIIMLDSISKAFEIGNTVIGFLIIFWAIGNVTNAIRFPWYYFLFVIFELVLLVGAIFIPNTRQMATIIILPKIINNEKIQNIGNNALDTTNTLLELTQKYLSEQIKKGDK